MADQEKETEMPLDKMTAIELRELAKAIPEITGVHGMRKAELLAAVKEARGIKEEVTPKADKTVGGIKKKIKALKAARQAALESKDKKMAKIYRRRISRLKKQTRKAA